MATALSAFVVLFLAELGDRTQLLIVSLAARHRPAPVVGGLALGYAVTNLLSVALGTALGAALPERAIGVGGGLLFLAFAVWTLRGTDVDEDGVDDRDRSGLGSMRLVLALAGSLMVAELGDKSMLATTTLAAGGNPVAVWVGATAGVIAAGGVGVAAGRFLARRVSDVVLRRASALLFTGFGVALLVRAL